MHITADIVFGQVVTLLLHQRRLAEALQQFRLHIGRFRRPAALQGAPPAAAAAHAGWLARQYAAMAELLAGRIDPATVTADQVLLQQDFCGSFAVLWSTGVSVIDCRHTMYGKSNISQPAPSSDIAG